MKFGHLLAAMAAIGAGLAARVQAEQATPQLLGIRFGGGTHRRVAPEPTGALRIQRAAKKRRNQARHRAACRSAKR